MRLLTQFQLLIFLALIASFTTAHSQMAEFRAQFEADQCELLDAPLKSYRSELRNLGRINLQVDYMLAVCRCKLPGLVALLQLPSVYRHLTKQDLMLIGASVSECNSGTRTLASIPSGGAIVMGKGGRKILGQLADDSTDLYAKRIFDHDNLDEAEAGLRERGFNNIVKRKDFILTGDTDKLVLERAGNLMDEVLESFVSTFEFESPRTLTTVYLYKDEYGMRQHAKEEHGVEISSGIYAYTFPLDASITLRRSGGLGTVGHEVFHVLLNQNAPYTPPWLNEGAAALFEEFRITPDNLIEGTYRPDHWRVSYLRNTKLIPIETLLAMDWNTFDAHEAIQQNHATSKFFVMYLQQQQKLHGLLKAYASNDIFDDLTDIKLLETQFEGKQLSEIASDFEQWLLAKITP